MSFFSAFGETISPDEMAKMGGLITEHMSDTLIQSIVSARHAANKHFQSKGMSLGDWFKLSEKQTKKTLKRCAWYNDTHPSFEFTRPTKKARGARNSPPPGRGSNRL